MKKHPCSSAESICQYGIKSLQRLANFNLTIRLVALTLICALLSPVFLFNSIRKTTAQARLSSSPAAPVSAAPQPFVFSSDNAVPGLGAASVISAANDAALGFFAAPQLPEGFETAKPASAFAGFTSSIAAFFGFSAKKIKAVSRALPAAPLPAGSVFFDFDNDGRADVSRWRSSTGEWAVKNSSDNSITNYNLGSSSSVIVPADYDGDGKTDFAVFNPSSGDWTIHESAEDKDMSIAGFGQPDDKPVVGDYDGDSKADAALFRPSNRTWYVRQSSRDGNIVSTEFGISSDIPVPGNYDGDSQMDYAVYRPSTGNWHILYSSSGGGGTQFHWGLANDIPVPADYDGDNKTDVAVYRGSTGTWYAYQSSGGGQYLAQTWGNYGDQPVPADYDRDGKAEFAVWRPSTSTWHFYKSCNYDNSCGGSAAYEYAQLGINGDVPAPASYLKQIGSSIQGYDLAKARLSPKNATGATDLYSRNFSWGTELVSLPGRTGLNAGFGISYNSLIWTKQGSNIYFDTDNSNISPGFRFGFPVIEPVYYDDTGSRTFNYLMVSPSGARVQFRQVNGASGTYETADSSYTQLKTIGAGNPNEPVENITITVTGTDGTKMTFAWKAGAFRCSEIKDRNGNFITVNHDEYGLLRTVTDTLGRIITVNYDSELYPTSITQDWKNNNGQGTNVTHSWATFTYGTQEINTNFNATEITNVSGPPNETILKVLKKVTYPNGNSTQFEYNSYGQVWQIINYAADSPVHWLNQVRTDLQNPANGQTDCPRLTKTYVKVENFNNNQETVTHNEVIPNQPYSVGGHSGTAALIKVWMENHPDGAISKTYVGASGWRESLPLASEDWITESGSEVRKRWRWTNWTQDNPNLSYLLNPRVIESEVGDTTNIKKTSIEYYPVSAGSAVALYGLVKKIQVLDGVAGTLLKEAITEYKLDNAYVSRRIIGLPLKTEISGLNQTNNTFELVSKVTYSYDGDDFSDPALEQNIPDVIQHDNTNYGASFVTGRGNLTATSRYDVTGETATVTSSAKYNTAGAVVAQLDPLGRAVKISYADKFNDSTTSRNTYAYPTTLTDPVNKSSTVKYRFDIGANVWAKSPDLNSSTEGKVTARIFDSLGRLQRESIFKGNQAYVNNQEYAYTRYEYPANNVQSKVYTTVIDTDGDGADTDDEVFSESWTDGAGRVLKSRTEHTGSIGGYIGSLTEYDILGRIKRSSVPTEINSNWTPAGDDLSRGWLWNSQEYDWRGRTARIVPPDSTGSDGKDQLFSYSGCGCAGGEVVTAESALVPRDDQPTSSARRKQKIYSDILGRNRKTEMYDWQGNIYQTVVNFYNGRDQIVSTQQHAGTENSNDFREISAAFDGHGRLKARHAPEQAANKFTTYTYYADDKPQTITDARGATKHYSYNNLGLIQQINWTVPENSGIEVPANVTFLYDAGGNRIQMDDGFGRVVYDYNELSQLKSETRQFNETIPLPPTPNSNNFEIQYTYGLSGQLTSYKEPYGEVISYGFDKVGRFKTVSGNRTVENMQLNYVTNTDYRAWGAVKQLDYGNNISMTMKFNNRLQAHEYNLGSTRVQYSYYNDGKLRSSDIDEGNNYLPNFDRLYQYDFLERLTTAKTGAEARGQVENNPNNRPYRMTLEYNRFGDIINQQRLHWTASFDSSFEYQDSRMVTEVTTKYVPNWVGNSYTIPVEYDADGRKIADTSGNQKYDAEGRLIFLPETDLAVKYDGDGNKIKVVEGVCQVGTCPNLQTQTNFYIKSSVLGEFVSEISNGTRRSANRETKIYGGGKQIAERRMKYIGDPTTFTDATFLQTTDPSGVEQTELALHISGNYYDVGGGTLDPFRAGVGYANPYPTGTPDPNYPNCDYGHDGEPGDDCEMPDFEDPENVEGEVGSIFENDCYANGFRRNCNDLFKHQEIYEEETSHYKLFRLAGSGKYALGLNSPTGHYEPVFSNNQVKIDGVSSNHESQFEGFKFIASENNLTGEWDDNRKGFTTEEISDVRKNLKNFISSKCEEFLSNFFRELGEVYKDTKAFKSNDSKALFELFDETAAATTEDGKLGFYWSSGGGPGYGGRSIHGIPSVGLWTYSGSWYTNNHRMRTLIHELIHNAVYNRSQNIYSLDHKQMYDLAYTAASKMAGAKPYPAKITSETFKEYTTSDGRKITYLGSVSGYFNDILKEFCP
jgi:hypothetical protein